MSGMTAARRAARRQAVRTHLEGERAHDVAAVLASYGGTVALDLGQDAGRFDGRATVGAVYGELFRAFPDLDIEIVAEHVADDTIVVELVLHGTQAAPFLGLPSVGARLALPACAVFEFDEDDRLTCERVYFDRARMAAQLTGG